MSTSAGRVIVAAAEHYQGVPYLFGGGSPRGWDCSGMVNWVLGHDLHMTLPGGVAGFDGASHGPVVVAYAAWKGATTVKGPPQAGDLCVWPGIGALGHIGIAVNGTHMISALNPQYGTAVTPIAGFGPPVPVVYRRLSGVTGAAGSSTDTGSSTAAGSLPAGCVGGMVMMAAFPVLLPVALVRRRQRAWRPGNR